jgi:hypothetical protein
LAPAEAKGSSSPSPFTPGREVKLLYPPGISEAARADAFQENWFLPIVFSVLGLGLILDSALLWVFRFQLFEQYNPMNTGHVAVRFK